MLNFSHEAIALETAWMRGFAAFSLRNCQRAITARLFCVKIFALFSEKSWQSRAWFSNSHRTCGRERTWCEQVVNNVHISIPFHSVTASSPTPAGNLPSEKVNMRVPRCLLFENVSAKRLMVSNSDPRRIFVERMDAASASHRVRFSLWIPSFL
jgi:hypothetical protein